MLRLKAALLIRITRAKASRIASPGNHRSPASLQNCFGKWNARLCASTKHLLKLRFIGTSSIPLSGVCRPYTESGDGRGFLSHRFTMSPLRVRWFRRFKRDQGRNPPREIAFIFPRRRLLFVLPRLRSTRFIERVSIAQIIGLNDGYWRIRIYISK